MRTSIPTRSRSNSVKTSLSGKENPNAASLAAAVVKPVVAAPAPAPVPAPLSFMSPVKINPLGGDQSELNVIKIHREIYGTLVDESRDAVKQKITAPPLEYKVCTLTTSKGRSVG